MDLADALLAAQRALEAARQFVTSPWDRAGPAEIPPSSWEPQKEPEVMVLGDPGAEESSISEPEPDMGKDPEVDEDRTWWATPRGCCRQPSPCLAPASTANASGRVLSARQRGESQSQSCRHDDRGWRAVDLLYESHGDSPGARCRKESRQRGSSRSREARSSRRSAGSAPPAMARSEPAGSPCSAASRGQMSARGGSAGSVQLPQIVPPPRGELPQRTRRRAPSRKVSEGSVCLPQIVRPA